MMDISFATWRVLIDLFERKAGNITGEDLKVFRLVKETKDFYSALTEPSNTLCISVILDSQRMDQYYINNAQKQKIEQGLLAKLSKKITFQFCLYSY